LISYTQYNTLPGVYVRKKMTEFLAEDMPTTDVTTEGTMGESILTGTARVIAMQNLVFAGASVIPYCFENSNIILNVSDGDNVIPGQVIAEIKGGYAHLLTRERIMLNLIQRLCGIASNTRKYVEIACSSGITILDTRKTTPGLRLFEKYAVAAGGGSNHRLDLSSGILIKDNHIQSAGSVAAAVAGCKKLNSALAVELEVDTLDQIYIGLEAKTDGFLLDNMSPETTCEAVSMIRNSSGGKNIFIESSGGITLKTLPGYLDTGIDAVSIGALTHSAGSKDIKLEFI